MEIKQILRKLPKKSDTLLAVNITKSLKLFYVNLGNEVKVIAARIIDLPQDNRQEAIKKALHSFLQENKISQMEAILIPDLKSLLIRRLQLPAMPQGELPEAIRWQLKDSLHFDLALAVVDFSVIQEVTKEDGAKLLEVICAVATLEEIKAQVLILQQAGLNCLGVAPLAFGYAKLIEHFFPPQKNEPVAVLHTEGENSFLGVYKDRQLQFYRELPVSIEKMKASLSGAFATDQGIIELSTEEINRILFEQGFSQENKEFFKDKIAFTQIMAMLRAGIDQPVQEIKRSLAYYVSEFHAQQVSRLYISGRATRIPGIEEILHKELGLEVTAIALKDKLRLSSDIDPLLLSENAAILGLALDYPCEINLLPPEFRSQKLEKLQKVSLRWIAFISLALLVFSYTFAKVRISIYQKRLENAHQHLGLIQEIKQLKVRIDEFHSFIMETRKAEPPLGVILKKLSNISDRELFLDNFSLNTETKSAFFSGIIKTKDRNPDTILTKFAQALEDSGYFKEATISSVEKNNTGETNTLKFSIAVTLP